MKVLVTGGAGFIGSNYLHYHLEKRPKDEVTVLDALTYSGNKANLSDLDLRFVEGHIENKDLVDAQFKKHTFDWVINFAAETHVDRSIKDPSIFVRSNVAGTQVLLDAAVKYGVGRFHQISSDEVYGDLGFGSKAKFDENSPLVPSSPYSATKAASDLLCIAYQRTFGVPVTISRCSNNYGAFQSAENFIPKIIMNAVNNVKIPVYGTGKNIRDWLYVRDHCEAVLLILEKGKIGEIYNVGGNCEVQNIETVKKILKTMKKSTNLIQFVEDRKGHDERYAINFSKLKSELAWSPKTNFEEGLCQTIEWYKLNSYERSYTRWWNGYKARSAHKSHKQTSTAGL